MPVQWNESAIRQLTEDAKKKALEHMRRAALSAPCPEHGQTAQVMSATKLQACCEKGKAAAEAAIARAFPKSPLM
jgi:hypothetical protein